MESISRDSSMGIDHDEDAFFLGIPAQSGKNTEKNLEKNMEKNLEKNDQRTHLLLDASSMSSARAKDSESLHASMPQIPDKMYFRIGDVAELAGVKPYVLRYWENEFSMINPDKSTTGQRVYRRSDVEAILLIKHLLYKEKYSIEGARKRLQELKREGQLTTFKKDKIYGGHETALLQERLKKIHEVAKELHDLVRVPVRDLFKY